MTGLAAAAVAPAPDVAYGGAAAEPRSPAAVTIHVPSDGGLSLSQQLPPLSPSRALSLSTHLADVARPPITTVTVQPAPQLPAGGLVYTLPSLAEQQSAIAQANGNARHPQPQAGAFANAPQSATNQSNPGTPGLRAADTPSLKAQDEAARNSSYALELQRQKRLLPAVPNVAITFHDVSVSVQVPVVDRGFETVGGRMWNTVTFAGLRGKNRTKQFDMIAGATGVIRPGTLTLVLAPPGHGKSTLLKALATRVKATAGAVRYNGLTEAEALEKGVFVNKLVQYVDQADVHNPLLTVHETFQFAVDNFCVDPTTLPDQANLSHDHKAQLQKLHEAKAETMVGTLGLTECRDTILGNALLRGVSGGQKKRVTLGETLLSEARVLCLDEVTNGLDSSTALDIFRSLRTWAQVTGGSVVAALQQPTPELFGLFDELILLKEGHTVYTGPATQAIPYLESIGYVCPQDSDFCDFMVEFLTHPKFVLQLQNVRASVASPPTVAGPGPYSQAFNSGAINSSAAGTEQKQSGVEMQPLKTPATADAQAGPQGWVPTSTLELVKQFADTHIAKDQLVQIAASERSTPKASAAGGVLLNDYCRALYGNQYAHSVGYHLGQAVKRQRMLNGRNKGLTGPRIGQAVMMSLLLGSLFYDTGLTQFPERIALILFALTFVAFGNMSELPIAVEAKRVLYKQTDSGMFPTFVYVFGVVLCHLPLLLIETTIFTIVLYFLTSFTHDAGAFFIFLAIMICSGLCMSVFFRMLAYVAPNEEIAQAMAGPSTGIFMLFGGFFITRNSVPDFMIWLYWLSPFSWSVRSLAVNEFRQTRYKEYVVPETGAVVDIGQLYLDTYEMQSEHTWVWNGPLLLLGYFMALCALSIYVLQNKRYELSRGTKRFEEETNGNGNGNGHGKRASSGDANPAAADAHASAAASALPFTPVTLSFKEIHYTIVDDKGNKKKLLTNVSGYAKPKTLTALMGVSGAGKTTLMDVIAGRKTQGTIEGDILVNGKKVSAAKFARLSGYVEQDDIHNPTATVRETLLFAAHLRLPESVSAQAKEQFVDELLELLELKDISDQIIGNAVILGLAPGQLKRVTIGVELVANPTILFLDEPTTGLDSRSAYTVMRVIKKIAASGRSVVCTIHQPSAELFYMFDALLLLAPGGVQTYFGSVGYRARGLVQYFEALGAPRKPRRMNPASWMLDVIGAGTGANAVALDVKSGADGKAEVALAKPSTDFGLAYAQSSLYKHCDEQLALITQGVANGAGAPIGNEAELTRYATGILTQFYHYNIRLFLSYWRNLPFIWNRGVVLLVLSVVFGLVYFDLKSDTQGNVLSKISVMFVTGGFAGIIHSATSLPVLMDQRAVYYRERSANTYMSIVYSVSIFIVELPFIAAYNAMFLAIAYFMIGLENDGTAWAKYYFAHIMLSYVYVSMAHFLTSVMPNKLVAGIVQGMYFSMFFLFGGMLVNGQNVPAGWKWMWHITPVHHALESLVMPQFEGATQLIPIVQGASAVMMPVKDYVSSYLAFDYGNYYGPLGWLALIILVLRCLVILCMEKVSFIKR